MVDVVVIGAGAAGIAAAEELHGQGIQVVVLEARDRIGGRAFTSYGLAPHPIELGAEFIHGENVATWDWVRRFGAETVDDANRPIYTAFADGRLWNASDFAARPNAEAVWRSGIRARQESNAGAPDQSVAEALEGWKDYWPSPPSPDDLLLLRNAFSELHAADIEDVGIAGMAESTYEGDGVDTHFRLAAGYSSLLQQVASGIEIRLRTPVTSIAWHSGGVRVQTGADDIEARAAIVTLPLGVLQAGDIAFDPPLPADKQAAIAGLGAGNIGKIAIRFAERLWEEDFTFLLTTHPTQLWWRPGEGRTDEAPVLTAFFGGRDADRFGAMAADEAVAEAVQHLEEIYGRPLAHLVADAHVLVWGNEPYTRMGYSHVPPGGVGRRAALAAPVEGTLFFAGEATNIVRPATVHGAIESGIRAAREAATALTGATKKD
jgi:monoamine oxidase